MHFKRSETGKAFEGEFTLIFHTIISIKYVLEASLGEYFFQKEMETSKEKLEQV